MTFFNTDILTMTVRMQTFSIKTKKIPLYEKILIFFAFQKNSNFSENREIEHSENLKNQCFKDFQDFRFSIFDFPKKSKFLEIKFSVGTFSCSIFCFYWFFVFSELLCLLFFFCIRTVMKNCFSQCLANASSVRTNQRARF